MAPAVYRSSRARRQPLVPASPAPPLAQGQLVSNLREIFNNCQHPGSTEASLENLKKLYKNSALDQFQGPFTDCVRKLLQADHNNYFKTACIFLCKFLEFVSKESDQAKTRNENASPTKNVRAPQKTQKQPKKSRQSKRFKRDDSDSEDEIVAGLFKKDKTFDDESSSTVSACSSQPETSITDHDQLISSVADIAGLYREVSNPNTRLNAVHFIYQFLCRVESLDEGICIAIKTKMLKSLRDKKAATRARAVLALRTFQDDDLTRKGFEYHFYRDPDPLVQKPLLQIMDTKVFGYEFLVVSTQDPRDYMRKIAYQRLSKVVPKDLSSREFHSIIHNGLNERDAQVAHKFRTQTLWPWLSSLYDGLDLHKMLEPFDIVNNLDDTILLLNTLYDHDRQQPQGNGGPTKLHHVVENFRERWLTDDTACLPNVEKVDERLVTIWLTLVKFCKDNQSIIEDVKIRTIRSQENAANESIEELLESQDNREESIDLYERLCPDLVNLVDFLKRYICFLEKQLDEKKIEPEKAEFSYLQIMDFMTTYEVGDELERKTLQEAFDTILRESLLVRHFDNFIPPIIKCLYRLVYSRSSNLMVNYISELIQNVRSHLEDIALKDTIQELTLDQLQGLIFKDHPNELTKCLQMYLGCLQNVRITEVPETMLAHLDALSYASLEDWFNRNSKVRCLMVACNGVTGLIYKNFVLKDEGCVKLLTASCFDKNAVGLDLYTTGFRCLVDVVCQHDELEFPERGEEFLFKYLEQYGLFKDPTKEKLEFLTAVIEGTTKLFYLQKLKSPDLLASIIIWWYHPHTPSKLKQFIGIFLPVFVNDLMKESQTEDSSWFKKLLIETFVSSVEILHDYILVKGFELMAANDLTNLINFLSNLIPVSLHPGIAELIDERMDELRGSANEKDLAKYLKQSRDSLTLKELQPQPQL